MSVFTIQKDGLSNKIKSSPWRMLFRPNGIFLGDNHVILYGAEVQRMCVWPHTHAHTHKHTDLRTHIGKQIYTFSMVLNANSI